MSIARQRREAAAALAVLMREKQELIDAAILGRDEDTAGQAIIELALLQQNNTKFLIFVCETYAATLKKLPGGLKRYAED